MTQEIYGTYCQSLYEHVAQHQTTVAQAQRIINIIEMDLVKKRILITGGSGFLGKPLVENCLVAGILFAFYHETRDS